MKRGNFYPKGVTPTAGGVQFVFKIERPVCDVEIGIFAGERELGRFPVPKSCRQGQLCSAVLDNLPKEADSYRYYVCGREMEDMYARGVFGMKAYGKEKGGFRYVLPGDEYDWGEDRQPRRPYGQSVIYGLHVRGFTKQTSSGVRGRGTFQGIREKIPYLKDLGITAVELMPAYEFDELEPVRGQEHREKRYGKDDGAGQEDPAKEAGTRKINYWGFKPGYYYAPKSAYAWGDDAVAEFKDMVKALHGEKIEVLMQFYFSGESGVGEVADVLRFWVEEYHVDGFHLIGERLPVAVLAADPFLKDTKLIYDRLPEREASVGRKLGWSRNVANWREDFVRDMRRALKGDEDCLGPMLKRLRDNEADVGVVNRIAGYGGFTLADLVSYDRKHNEENGEDNRDGEDYNFSWNCGAEGKTRKRSIQMLRQRQMKNALALVFLSQGTPYLQGGDEFGQSQGGNNNPYCQDSRVTWLDWKLLRTNRELYEFARRLIALRRAHAVFHREEPLRGLDYLGLGCPDVSWHGEEAWKPVLEPSCRCVGVMYSGKYAKGPDGEADADFYVAYNLHWEPHEFALPKLPRGMMWRLCLDTAQPADDVAGEGEQSGTETNLVLTGERSIQIFWAERRKSSDDTSMETL